MSAMVGTCGSPSCSYTASRHAARSSAQLPRCSPQQYVGFQSSARLPSTSAISAQEEFRLKTHSVVASSRSSGGPRRQVTRMMPIGVPRVPYRTPREGGWQWVDIWNCLYRERIMFIGKAVDDELGNQLVATMLYLDSENKKDINMYINCSGGEVVPCLAMFDTMKHINSDVATVGFGACMGMSGFLMSVGKKGKRYVLPNTTIMMHHPSGVARGQASDIQNEARELMRVRNYVNGVLSVATGQEVDTIQRDFNRNMYFNPQEAKDYGLIDQVVRPPRSQALGVA